MVFCSIDYGPIYTKDAKRNLWINSAVILAQEGILIIIFSLLVDKYQRLTSVLSFIIKLYPSLIDLHHLKKDNH